MSRSPRLAAKLALAAMISTVSPSNAGPAFDTLVVFGDSLSDVGNAGRFSNGPVWVEHLGRALGAPVRASELGGRNYAVGGARLDPASGPDSLRAQADRHLASGSAGENAVYVVFGGGNDLLVAVEHPRPAELLNGAVTSLHGIVADLIGRGARNLVVPNLPDVGMTPAVQSYGPAAAAKARDATARFNAAVDDALADIARRAPPDVSIVRLDVWSLAEQVRAAPQRFGFEDVTTPCARLATCDGYVFWDQVHPTAAAHERLGAAALSAIQAER